jgi:hypothetical protein
MAMHGEQLSLKRVALRAVWDESLRSTESLLKQSSVLDSVVVTFSRLGTLDRCGLIGCAGLASCPDDDRLVVALQEVIDELVAGLLLDQDFEGEHQRRQGSQETSHLQQVALTTNSSPRRVLE